MTGPKLNEKNFVAGEKSGTKASAKYVRSSARKARVVLDLIRDLPATRADQVLQFTDREIARTIRKVLASAVANAVNNDAQDAEELYVKACFADEGPTLRRFRPRARGRATRIRKRTCHITIVLDRMSEQQLAVQQAKSERGGRVATSSSASRRARVEASRQRAAVRKSGAGEAVETVADQPSHDEIVEATEAAVTAGEWAGSALPLEDGTAPEGYSIKGNADSMLYHVPGGPSYKATKAEVYFDTVESAEAAGFAAPGSDDEDNEPAADAGDAEETN